MVNICFGYEDKPERIRLLIICWKGPSITTLFYTIKPKDMSYMTCQPQVYHGQGYITEKLGSSGSGFGPKSFFQTNSRQGERLYETARIWPCSPAGKRCTTCIATAASLFVSDRAGQRHWVETVKEAVEDAKRMLY